MPTLALLASGSGTLLEAFLDSDVQVSLVVTDRPCRALSIARERGVETTLVNRQEFGGFGENFSRDRYSVVLARLLREKRVDLVAMAGFGTVLDAAFFEDFDGTVLNTHPSLLPHFKGWHAVALALEAGVTESGCTVHVATAALDDGPILAQGRVPVEPGDDEETLHERIKVVEREMYPRVVRQALEALALGENVATVRYVSKEAM